MCVWLGKSGYLVPGNDQLTIICGSIVVNSHVYKIHDVVHDDVAQTFGLIFTESKNQYKHFVSLLCCFFVFCELIFSASLNIFELIILACNLGYG